jgi:aryl-alcohol dehydrogenase-like predicted oxidoreductase
VGPQTPIEETMEALHEVVCAGKASYLGASSMYAWQFANAQLTARAAGWTRFVSRQNHYNLVYREEEREMIPFCADQGVGVLPYSPLARGLLAGSRDRGGRRRTVRSGSDPVADRMYTEADFEVVDAVRAVAAERGVPPARIALAWAWRPVTETPAASRSGFAVLTGAGRAGGGGRGARSR